MSWPKPSSEASLSRSALALRITASDALMRKRPRCGKDAFAGLGRFGVGSPTAARRARENKALQRKSRPTARISRLENSKLFVLAHARLPRLKLNAFRWHVVI